MRLASLLVDENPKISKLCKRIDKCLYKIQVYQEEINAYQRILLDPGASQESRDTIRLLQERKEVQLQAKRAKLATLSKRKNLLASQKTFWEVTLGSWVGAAVTFSYGIYEGFVQLGKASVSLVARKGCGHLSLVLAVVPPSIMAIFRAYEADFRSTGERTSLALYSLSSIVAVLCPTATAGWTSGKIIHCLATGVALSCGIYQEESFVVMLAELVLLILFVGGFLPNPLSIAAEMALIFKGFLNMQRINELCMGVTCDQFSAAVKLNSCLTKFLESLPGVTLRKFKSMLSSFGFNFNWLFPLFDFRSGF